MGRARDPVKRFVRYFGSMFSQIVVAHGAGLQLRFKQLMGVDSERFGRRKSSAPTAILSIQSAAAASRPNSVRTPGLPPPIGVGDLIAALGLVIIVPHAHLTTTLTTFAWNRRFWGMGGGIGGSSGNAIAHGVENGIAAADLFIFFRLGSAVMWRLAEWLVRSRRSQREGHSGQ